MQRLNGGRYVQHFGSVKVGPESVLEFAELPVAPALRPRGTEGMAALDHGDRAAGNGRVVEREGEAYRDGCLLAVHALLRTRLMTGVAQ